jgi:hypothetical protein
MFSRHRWAKEMTNEEEIERLKQWKELAYEMRNRSWWAMRNKVLMQFDYMHKRDWEQR